MGARFKATAVAAPVLSRRDTVRAFWCRIPSRANFGDALTPWLIRRITGRFPIFTLPENPIPKYFITGSVIAYADRNSTVWGSGIMSGSDRISPEATLLAVRGPLTRARALASGAPCPEVYGDPALLLPRYYRPAVTTRYGIGIAPHFSDMPRLVGSSLLARMAADASRLGPGARSAAVRLIDLQCPVERVIDEIVSCEVVASSSLHGIIVAHAYGVPAVWLKFRDLPAGDDSKFHDYFLSIGIDPPQPVRPIGDAIDLEELRWFAKCPGRVDLDNLARTCPFVPKQ